MTTTTDWPQGVDPMPSMEPSSDLFDGDILGDELIDIYNAAVVGGSDEDTINGRFLSMGKLHSCWIILMEMFAEIPTLLAHAPENEKKGSSVANPGGPDSTNGSAADDGLGAFRPSTSFNDLSTLLPPTTASVGSGKAQKLAPVVSSTVPNKAGASKKRSNSSSDAPAAKRRANGGRKGNGNTPKKGTKTGSGNKVSKGPSGKQSNNTPNPLIAGGQLAVAAPSGIQTIKPIVKPAAAPSSGAAVVTPRFPINTKDNPDSSSANAPQPTEADFKSVAQAAVSNLILNAGTKSEAAAKKPSKSNNDLSSEKIDTSTEHIKALTGSNWVAVCSGDGDSGSNAGTDKMNNRARRQNLTPDERARQNRDRNREHARNTRLRKKAYVEELKRTLTALVAQRDATELEKRHSAQRELEQREVRFRVVEEFLKLRGRNELNYARWAAILEERFTLTLPNTDYRETVPNERGQFEQKLSGVSQVMDDSNMLAGFLQGLGKGNHGHDNVVFVFDCDRKNFFMDNCTAVLNWTATTHGAMQQVCNINDVLK